MLLLDSGCAWAAWPVVTQYNIKHGMYWYVQSLHHLVDFNGIKTFIFDL